MSIIDGLKKMRSECRTSLGELNRDLRIISGNSTRRIIETEIELIRGRIDRFTIQIEKREGEK